MPWSLKGYCSFGLINFMQLYLFRRPSLRENDRVWGSKVRGNETFQEWLPNKALDNQTKQNERKAIARNVPSTPYLVTGH